MVTVNEVAHFLDGLAPVELAESWDNTGLLVGDSRQSVTKVMTCLTITPESAAEAIERGAELIVTHHPLPFRPLATLTTETTTGRLLWDLIGAQISIYSAHTRFDSAANGINQQIGQRLGLLQLRPLTPATTVDDQGSVGVGRCGEFSSPTSLGELTARLKSIFHLPFVDLVGALDHPVKLPGIACGSGGSFLASAIEAGCDALITGETSFHSALECRAQGIGLVLLGHFASERFAMEILAGEIGRQFDTLQVWASETETNPLVRI